MSVNPEESRWTAYVLDEVELPERAELEAILASSPQARTTLASIEDAIDQLQDGFQENPQFRLTESQLSEVLDAEGTEQVASFPVSAEPSTTEYPFTLLQAVAAVVTVSLFLGFVLFRGLQDGGHFRATLAREEAHQPGMDQRSSRLNGSADLNHKMAGSNHSVTGDLQSDLAAGAHPGDDLGSSQAAGLNLPFVRVADQPVLNCYFETETGGYEAARQSIWAGQLPSLPRVNVGELISYFSYDYPVPLGGQPLSVHMEATVCPWNARHRLVQVGLKGGERLQGPALPVKVILLLDGVEVRERGFDRAVLLQVIASLRQRLQPDADLAVIDGSRIDRTVLHVDRAEQSVAIIESLVTLPQGAAVDIGVSNQWLQEKIIGELSVTNRNEIVLVAGEGNGSRNRERIRLLALVEQAAPGAATYSLLGIGTPENAWLEQALAANPVELYPGSVNSVAQANHFWESMLTRSALPVARDLKMQLEFNSESVAAYRQLGLMTVRSDGELKNDTPYERHDLKEGEELTSLFEVIPKAERSASLSGEALVKDSNEKRERSQVRTQNMLTVKLNYRLVSDDQSVREVFPFEDRGTRLREASDDLKFSAAVAAHGMVLSDAPFRGTLNHYGILELAQDGLGEDLDGDRNEFLELVKRTIRILLDRRSRVSG